jgi:hypothetical protein
MRRFYNKGAKGLSGGQVKLDKMGNNDGKISGEDFAVMRSRKMGGGMMKRPMYKAGSANPKAKSKTSMKQAKAGMESQKATNKKAIKIAKTISKFNPLTIGITAAEEGKKINSKIKNSRTLKMGGGRVKKAGGGGLYANIKAKKDRIAAGSGEKMRKVGSAGAPTAQNFINAAKTAKKV